MRRNRRRATQRRGETVRRPLAAAPTVPHTPGAGGALPHPRGFTHAPAPVRRTLALVGLLAAAIAPAACGLYRNDRCWVAPEHYALARQSFLETGSLDITRQRMELAEWRRCEINEVLYRLNKEFEVLPEQWPADVPRGESPAVP